MQRTKIGETQHYFIGPNGLKRIARARADVDNEQCLIKTTNITLPLRVVEDNAGGIVVVFHMNETNLGRKQHELLYIAQALAGEEPVRVVCFGKSVLKNFEKGADQVLLLNEDAWQQYQPKVKLKVLDEIQQKYYPKHYLFSDTIDDVDLAKSFATKKQLSFANNVVELGQTSIKRLLQSCTKQQTLPIPKIMCLKEGLSNSELEYRCECKPLTLNYIVDFDSEQSVSQAKNDQMNLQEADFICAAGNGITDIEIFKSFAKTLGAVIGASRVVVDNGKFDKIHQVGATGVSVQSNVYVALGISGAIQHLQGIEKCNKIVAVNTDPHCTMVKRANLSIIHDANILMKEVMQIVNKEKSNV